MGKKLEDLKKDLIQIYFDKIEVLEQESNIENSMLFLENIVNTRVSLGTAGDDFLTIDKLRERLLKSKTLSPKENVLLGVLGYLLLAEGVICNCLNFTSFLLVATGHDLFSQTKRSYVKENMKEIMKVEMSTKIKLLNYHGFRALTKEYDSTFRNDIAHHNYSIDEKGVLLVRGKPVTISSKLISLKPIIKFYLETTGEMEKKLGKKRVKKLEKMLKDQLQ